MRADLTDGTTRTFSESDYALGEPLFVGKPGRTREGDGVLLVTGASERGAALFVLDATNLDVLAHTQLSTHLPLALHGSFIPV